MDAKAGSKKQVCILNPNLRTFGGGEKLTAYVCKFFEDYFKENVQIDIFAPYIKLADQDERPPVPQEALNEKYKINLTKVREVPLAFPEPLSVFDSIKRLRAIEKFTRKYDYFVNLNFTSVERGLAKFNIYNCMFPPKLPRSKNPIKAVCRALWSGGFYKSYDVFINISNFTDFWQKKYWPNVKKSAVIYPPCFDGSDLKGRYDERQKKNIILSVGRFFVNMHNKKQLEMVRFFAGNKEKMRNYEFHLVGNVDANTPQDLAYLKDVKELAAKTGDVFVHENCPYSELVELYKSAKIFWHATGYGIQEDEEPEKLEHFGITTVEAMSYGVVPVVIDKAGQKEIVEHGESGFKWQTEDECVEFTARLICNDELRKTMAKNARVSLEPFSYGVFYDKMESVIEKADK